MPLTTPRAIQIDASSHCQLACPVCPTATGRTRAVLGAGHLKLAEFQRLLDANPEIAEVELSNYGEMFLNPQLPDLLACAFERRVVVSGSNGVNLNFARDEALEAVVKYRVRALTCSIDGATQETYAKYRINGDLSRVLAHVDRIRELRREHRSAFPLLDWQFVVFGHNEHEIESARSLARQRGMQFVPRLSWNAEFSPVVNPQLVAIQTGLGASNRVEYREKKGREYARELCFQLWHAPVVNWDGKMLGCCVNFWKDFGTNVFDDGLSSAMAHPDLDYARRMLMGLAPPRPGIPCTTCNQFEALADSGRWLTEQEAKSYERTTILVGVVPSVPDGVAFGQFSVATGRPPGVSRQTSGRLFRLGLDTAVYFSAPAPGTYTVFANLLGPSGWLPSQAYTIHVTGRPVCQEFGLDLRRMDSPALISTKNTTECLPSWIL
jgi:hypothetical protein